MVKLYTEGSCTACRKVGWLRVHRVENRVFRWCENPDNDKTCRRVVFKIASTYQKIKRGLIIRVGDLTPEQVQGRHRRKRDLKNFCKELRRQRYLRMFGCSVCKGGPSVGKCVSRDLKRKFYFCRVETCRKGAIALLKDYNNPFALRRSLAFYGEEEYRQGPHFK